MRRLLACALLMLAVLGAISAPASAQDGARNGIVVVQIKGLLDMPNVSLLRDTIEQVNEDDRTLLLIQLDSRGVIADVGPAFLAIARSRVPVVVWIGPSGAEAKGDATTLALAAHARFIASGSTFGPLNPLRLDKHGRTCGRDCSPPLPNALFRPWSASEVVRKGVVDGQRPTIGETIVKLDGKTIETAAGEIEVSTARVIGEGRDRRRQPNQEVSFVTLDAAGQVQHALISPSVAYFFLVIGLALIVFEFFAASVGFAAFIGALMVVGAFYGFSHLPVHWWAVALLLLSAFGFAVDAQAGGLGFWTGVGVLTLLTGSFTLVGGTDLSPSWWTILIVVALAILLYATAIPAFIRSRFSTPTVGREAMVGEIGTAEVAVAPDGVVVVREARWRARTNRATPIGAGDRIRVIAVDGLVLEVEPESGGARDYRDRGRRKKKDQS